MLHRKNIVKKTLAIVSLGFAVLTAASSGQIVAQTGNPFASSVAKLDPRPASTSTDGSSSALPLPPPASNWSGFYLGGYGGGTFSRARANTSTVFSPTGYFATSSVPAISVTGTQQLNANGATGGGQVGYNHQSGNFVIGAEADFGAMRSKKTATNSAVYPCCSPTAFTITQSVKTNWLFTARPRAGFTTGKALFYATGGIALTDLNYQAVFTDTFATATENGGIKKTRLGWTAGGGIEAKIASKWSAKAEYLFADFRRVTTTSSNLRAFTPAIAFPTNVFTHSIYLREHMVRFGINYHF